MTELKDLIGRHSTRRFDIRRVGSAENGANGSVLNDSDWVAIEEPLEIRLGYSQADGRRAETSISITMRTPGNDDELAIGFLVGEGIVSAPTDVDMVRPCGPPADNGLINVIRVELAPTVEFDLARLERHFYTTSSCGVCGKASLDAVAVNGRYDIANSSFALAGDVLQLLPEKLIKMQSLFEKTGGLHASGLFTSAGEIIAIREDVGRHNALDKLIGMQFRAGGVPLLEHGLLFSGRASFELLQKAMVAGCPLVASVGAPSSLAVELAQEFGLTLVGFLSKSRFNIYTRADRIVL